MDKYDQSGHGWFPAIFAISLLFEEMARLVSPKSNDFGGRPILRLRAPACRPSRSRSAGQAVFFYDGYKRIRLEACPADQGPVDIWLGHQFGDILRLDASAVLDTQRFGGFFIVHFCQQFTDKMMDFLRLGRGSGLAGTDGPDRLVGD